MNYFQVLEVGPKSDGRIRVEFNVYAEPSLEHVMQRERVSSLKIILNTSILIEVLLDYFFRVPTVMESQGKSWKNLRSWKSHGK